MLSLQSFMSPQKVKAASFQRLSLASCIYVQIKHVQIFWIFLPVKGRGTSQFPLSLSCLKSCRMNAIWQSYSLRSSSPLGRNGLTLPPPIFIPTSINIIELQRYKGALICRSTIRVQSLQGSVDVHKNDDYQVENGPNDAQHGQDGLLFTFLVLGSLFLITVDSVYHFPWKSLQFSFQTNLEQADKREKKTQSTC